MAPTKTTTKEKTTPKSATVKERYIEGVGRRKTSVARVRITHLSKKTPKQEMVINDVPFEKYFPSATHQRAMFAPLEKADMLGSFKTTVKVVGGGISSQVGAVRHGLSRALISFDPDLRKKLKVFGFLTRDPRMVERKKFGLKKARRAPQWAKR